MSANPSIVIGLGTSGSEIVARIYAGFKEYCEDTGVNENLIQFLMIDTQDAIRGAEDLRANGQHLMIGVPDGERIRKANWEANDFFREWWYEKYIDVGSLVHGAGTRPPKGRLAFWAKLGDPTSPDNFQEAFQDASANVITAKPESVHTVHVFIINTLSGGTGSGIFLDVAQIIHANRDIETEIHGVFMLPSTVHLLADPDAYKRIGANGYGALISLNYWMTPANMRQIVIEPYMELGTQIIQGDIPPLEACWLIGRTNTAKAMMQKWGEYAAMVANVISMQIYGELSDNIQARLNDFLTDIHGVATTETSVQPRRYASFAAYNLRYSPENAAKYLGIELAGLALDGFRIKPGDLGMRAKIEVKEFFEQHEIRETSVEEDEPQRNEVIKKLQNLKNSRVKLYKRTETMLANLARDDDKTVFVTDMLESQVKKGRVKETVYKLKQEIEAGLTGELNGGVGFERILQENEEDLFRKVVIHSDKGQKAKQPHTSLRGVVLEKSRNNKGGFERSKSFLEHLKKELITHRESLEHELKGDDENRETGNRSTLNSKERSLLNDKNIKILEEHMFGGGLLSSIGNQREKAVLDFQRTFWTPWLSTKKLIMVKEQAIGFYERLEGEVSNLIDLLENEISPVLAKTAETLDNKQLKIYGTNKDSLSSRLEESALKDGVKLVKYFEEVLVVETPAALEMISENITNLLEEMLVNYKSREIRLQKSEQLADFLTSNLLEKMKERFNKRAHSISLWEAIKIDTGETERDRIERAVGNRIANVSKRCKPFWKIDPKFSVMFPGEKKSKSLYSYDEVAFGDFLDKYKIKLTIEEAANDQAENDGEVDESAYKASPYELKLLYVEGGVPLDMVDSVNIHKGEFISQREIAAVDPVLNDARLERLINQVGLPTWKIKGDEIDPEKERKIADLLMLEQFGTLKSPLVQNHRTSGTYKLYIHALSSVRKEAFEKLLEISKTHKNDWDRAMGELEVYRGKHTNDEWMHEYCVCYKRIEFVLDQTKDPKVQAVLQEQTSILLSIIKDEFGKDTNAIVASVQATEPLGKEILSRLEEESA